MTCAIGHRESGWQSYLSDWGISCCHGHNTANRDLCWSMAQKHVPGSVGIFWNFGSRPYCRAIDNLTSLGTFQSIYPNSQKETRLCLWDPTSGIQYYDLRSSYGTYYSS